MAWLYKAARYLKNWWLGYRLNGRQYLRSTKTSDRKKAEQELEKLRAVIRPQSGSLTDEFVALLTRKQSSGESLRAYSGNGWPNVKTCPGDNGEYEDVHK